MPNVFSKHRNWQAIRSRNLMYAKGRSGMQPSLGSVKHILTCWEVCKSISNRRNQSLNAARVAEEDVWASVGMSRVHWWQSSFWTLNFDLAGNRSILYYIVGDNFIIKWTQSTHGSGVHIAWFDCHNSLYVISSKPPYSL